MDDREIMVSITMISYNHEPYIRQCLDSILSQKVNFRYEVIIGEDCSPDNSRAILKEYEEKYPDIFVMLYNERNLGVSQNSANVKKHIRGKYVVGGETDDFWTDEKRLQKQVDFLESHPNYVAVGCNFYNCDVKGENFYKQLFRWQVNKAYYLKDYLRYGYTLHGNTLMYRNVLPYNDEKYLVLRKAIPTMGDVITRVLLYDKGGIFVLPDVMHAHRAGEATPTSFTVGERSKSIQHSYMYCKMVDELEKYLDNKYDLAELKANRAAAQIMKKRVSKHKIDKKEYKEYFNSLEPRVRRLARRRFVQKFFRYYLHRVMIKINRNHKKQLINK